MPTLAKKVFLSSTFIDLVEYRAAAIHACHRAGLLPVYMEDFPPDPRDAIAFCKAKVEEADFFFGVYAHRYGYVPDGSEESITEMEYDWAIQWNLPVHLFVIDPDYPWPASKIDRGKSSEQLDHFKERIGKRHTWKKFQDVGTFKEDVLLLSHDLARTEATSPTAKPAPTRWSLPTPPEMHSVPPYIQTTRFIGRQRELDDLDAWARSSDTILVVEAIGGVGKSALTWEWARDRAMKIVPGLTGTLWWSFYEGGASTASFVREALAYATEVDPEDLRAVPQIEQLQGLLAELRRRPYLLVLDGFERLLTAYHQLDPSKLLDDQVKLDQRACTNPLTEDLLRQLTACSPSKILLTTRLMPSSLENRAHQPVPGACHLKLPGLDPADGENLLKSLGIHGDSATIRRFLLQFDNHSLLIGVLAGRILDYRPAPRDFDRWMADPNEGGGLRLSKLDLRQRQTHILAYAFKGLELQSRKLLGRIAVLSDAADYTTISILNPYLPPPLKEAPVPLLYSLEWELDALHEKLQATRTRTRRALLQEQVTARLVDLEKKKAQQKAAHDENQNQLKAYLASPEYRAAITALDIALSNLEDRTLLQWDRHNNTYDLHPIIRGYVFDQLEEPDKVKTYERIRDYFGSLPSENLEEATELSQIRNTIQLYRALMGAGHIDWAADLYRNRLADPLFLSITSYPTVIELLSPMFPKGMEMPPALLTTHSQSFITYALGYALRMSGRHREAKRLEILRISLDLQSKDWPGLAAALYNYSRTLLHTDMLATALRISEIVQNISRTLGNESVFTTNLLMIANIYSIEGRWENAHAAYKAFASRPIPDRRDYRAGSFEADLCQLRFWEGSLQDGELEDALLVAIRGRNLLSQSKIHCLRAELSLRKGALQEAIETAEHAIEIAMRTGVPTFYAQGCIARALALQGRHNEAQKLVEEEDLGLGGDWQAAKVYLEVGDIDRAKRHALLAYVKAWADGPPHIFWWELERSKQLLAQLGVPEPELRPFNSSTIERIPFEDSICKAIKELEEAEKGKKEASPPRAWEGPVQREQQGSRGQQGLLGFTVGLVVLGLVILALAFCRAGS